MVAFLFVAVLTFLVGSGVGYAIHWMLHQRWAGPLHRSHMAHHLKQYPPDDLMSPGRYRSSGFDSGWLSFTPFVVGFLAVSLTLMNLAGLSLWMQAIVVVETAVVGYLHGYVHDAYHVEGHMLERLPYFERLRQLHWVHHFNMRRNLGIFFFGWDRVLGTFVKK